MSCGIYKITNLINNKSYIGCSKNIEHRWIAHKSESVIDKRPQYNYSIHKAFRKYGIDNFKFEIIELLPEEDLFDREIYWIKYYNTFNNGYNETEGGQSGPISLGEDNPNVKLTDLDVISIRTQLLSGKMASEVFPQFCDKISKSGFDHIWRGEAWPHILPEAIDYVKSEEYKRRVRAYAGQHNCSAEKVRIKAEIKEKKKKGLKRLEVYEEYKNVYSLSGFNKIWYQ